MSTIKNMVACMLFQSGMSIGYWGEAALYAAEIRKIIPPDGSKITPFEMVHKMKPKLKRYHPFGCAAYALLPPPKQKAFAPKADTCVFLGFVDGYEAFHLL